MSIATDEAAQKYPEPTDVDDPMYKYVEGIAGYPAAKRQGYVAGRTAEPTEVEIKAVVRAMYYRHAADWESDKDYARHLLEAARKEVME
jgi:hypothetical protein